MNNYIMVGAGGTGTHLLQSLILYLRATHKDGKWQLHIIDGDIVEEKNLERQVFRPETVTMNKAEAAILPFGNDEHLKAYPEYLSEESIPRFIQNGDTIFICVDNFTVRKRIEDHARTLEDVIIINGGNEKFDGSVQLWIRAKNVDLTPRLSYLHPEIVVGTIDRAEMTCAQAAALPGGEQTIIANASSALWMLTALWRAHNGRFVIPKKGEAGPLTWTELQFDAQNATVDHIDQRMSAHWRTA